MDKISGSNWNCLHEVLDLRVSETPDKVAISFLPRGEVSEALETLTYSQLRQKALATAIKILEFRAPGDRVLLIYNSGIEFAVGFWACVYANMIAIPLPVPKLKSNLASLKNVVLDATPEIIICSHSLQKNFTQYFSSHNDLSRLRIMCNSIDTLVEEPSREKVNNEDTVFLQYTSGSTGSPKGVMVSHKNLLANQKAMQKIWRNTSESVIVSWLPYYHDMGLIGTFIQSTYCGGSLVMFPPVAFAQNPLRWLEIINHFRGTNSGAPNFAYHNCVRAAQHENVAHFDLSCWEVAWNGAEPIHALTLKEFNESFRKLGFNPKANTPSYGLAEATLTVTTANKDWDVPLQQVSLIGSESGAYLDGVEKLLSEVTSEELLSSGKWAVSCGRCIEEHQLCIVDPKTFKICTALQIGEIWFSGSSVAKAYWNKPEISQQTFEATPIINDKNQIISGENFLRTGDLGYINSQGDLYVVGRCKDMMVIRGENHAPQDIEFTVTNCDSALISDGCAAFSVQEKGEEKLVVVQEVKRTFRKAVDFEKLLQLIRQKIAQRHNISLSALILINQSHLPKTTSGKVQRRLCKTLYFQQEWKSLYSWNHLIPDSQQLLETGTSFQNKQLGKVVQGSDNEKMDESKILLWLIRWLETELRLTVDEFDAERQFAAYGMDSQMTARMMYGLEQFTNLKLDPTLCWNYPCPVSLSEYVFELDNEESA